MVNFPSFFLESSYFTYQWHNILAYFRRFSPQTKDYLRQRSILQLIYVPIVSAHWVTKYPGMGLRTLTAVVTACNDRRYRQFHCIRPRVSYVCIGAVCGIVWSIEYMEWRRRSRWTRERLDNTDIKSRETS